VGRDDARAAYGLEYLDWYADVFEIAIENDSRVLDVAPDGAALSVVVQKDGATVTRRARAVVLATGYDGAGSWRAPGFVRDHLPAHRYTHTNGPLDVATLKDKRVGVLGHGASAFDNAIFALENGAKSAELCFRRAKLPRVNPHRALENAALLGNFPDLTRWRIAGHFRDNDQPPAVRSFETAMGMAGFRLRPGTPWHNVRDTASDFSAAVSQGPHSTSIGGHRHCLPRLVRGVERRLLLDREGEIVSALKAYRSADLPVSDDFEADFSRSPQAAAE
jgi:cation diffusion facilitator CzcD-associated flavoprotein CzcO